MTRRCFNCGAHCPRGTRQLKECSRCRLVQYCSRTCQRTMWSSHKIFCSARFLCERSSLELALFAQSRRWLKLARPILSQYAIWALNIAFIGASMTNEVCVCIQMDGSCVNILRRREFPRFKMKCGVVRPSGGTHRGREGVARILLIIEFRAMSLTNTPAGCVMHQIQFSITELPPLLQDLRMTRILQKNWANRLAHRLSRETW
ncbi:hypothetical protein QCA50_018561 [Cerrena zonata]|uniref:MYND-type domain-containing protein n=1 Tax=Cerrena zonata TaxID=2478898 RepID=A0AAW0FHE0_9APHY